MVTKQSLENDLRAAIRSSDDAVRRTLRLALAAVKLAEVDKRGVLDEAGLVSVLQKEVKSKRETILDAEKAGRPDLVEKAQQEISVLERYLPKLLSADELDALAQAAVHEAQAQTPADIGKVMKILMPRVQGRAPGDQVNQAVRKFLQP